MSDAATLPVAAAGGARLPATAGVASGGAGAVLERIKSFTAQPAVARSLPFLGMLAAAALAFAAWMTFATGPQRDLFAGLADADKAAVADQLTSAGIKYQIDRDTGAVKVSDSDYYRAKMLLAQAGLPKSAPDGDAIISALPMGASRAVEGERLRGAREMDLARTIEAIDAVESAKVHLAVEQPSVFVRDATPASASVMLRLRQGRALSQGQVQAIVNLVATSVPGLSPDMVSVVDQSGKLLSRQGGGDAVGDRQLELQQKTEDQYRDAITKLLTPLVGPDGFTSEVHADLDFAEVQATRESYPKDTGGLKAEAGGWNNDQPQTPAGGIPGAIANQPPTTAQVTPTPPAQVNPAAPAAPPQPGTTAAATQGKTSETYNRTFELGREVSVTKNPTGTIKRLSVAVALKQGAKPRSAAELKQIEDLVKSAVGFDQQRGDQFALSSRSFVDAAPEPAPKWYEASWVSMAARNGTALLIALLVFFGVAKPLMKRKGAGAAAKAAAEKGAGSAAGAMGNLLAETSPSPEIQREIAAAIASEAVADPTRPVTLDMIEAAPGYTDRATLIRNFVRQDPARAALVVRDLIRADMPGAAQNG